ncbi:hypothetical protein BTVI_63568 [Pitangus sulphuratus]|nr:hypothetical protein BTVI_63568 [Pitangus sulphuratus]
MDTVVSSWSFFTLGFLVVGVLESFFWDYHLFTVQVPGIRRVVTDVLITWRVEIQPSEKYPRVERKWECEQPAERNRTLTQKEVMEAGPVDEGCHTEAKEKGAIRTMMKGSMVVEYPG